MLARNAITVPYRVHQLRLQNHENFSLFTPDNSILSSQDFSKKIPEHAVQRISQSSNADSSADQVFDRVSPEKNILMGVNSEMPTSSLVFSQKNKNNYKKIVPFLIFFIVLILGVSLAVYGRMYMLRKKDTSHEVSQ